MPAARTRPQWTRLLAAALSCAAAAALLLAAIPLLFGSAHPMVHVRWRTIDADERRTLERRFGLTEASALDAERWAYVPTDTSPDTLRGLVTHPAVEDTDGIDRRAFTIAAAPPLTPRRGGLFEGAPRGMAPALRLLAYAIAIGGILLAAGAAWMAPAGALARARLSAAPAYAARAPRLIAQRLAALPPASREAMAVAALFLACAAWRFVVFVGFSNDQYAHLAMAQQWLMGDRPIRDFADPGWPLMYVLTAAGWRVAGDIMAVEWAIATSGFAIGAAATVAAASRLSGAISIAVLVAIGEILIFPRAYSYPKIATYAVGGWMLLAVTRRPSTRRLLWMAAIIAVAFLFRHDHGLFIGVAAALATALASRDEGVATALRRIGVLTTATAALLTPWIVYVALNGGLVAYLVRGLDFSRIEADATRLSSWPAFSARPLDTMANAEAWLFWLFWALAAGCGAAAVRRLTSGRERWAGEAAAVLAVAVLAALVNGTFMRESLQVRIPDAAVPAALLGAWALGACWTAQWRDRRTQLAARAASIVVIAISAAAIARVGTLTVQIDDAGVAGGIRGIHERAREAAALLRSPHRADAPSRYAVALQPFFAYLDRCTSSSDRLIVTGDFPDIPVLARRRFAGDGVVFGSTYASPRYQDETVARLRAEPPLFVLHVGAYEDFRRRFPAVDAWVDGEFSEMARIPVEGGEPVRILVHAARAPAGDDGATGWECYVAGW